MTGRTALSLTVVSAALLLASCSQPSESSLNAADASTPVRTRSVAPLLGTDNPEAIPGQYIVVLSEGSADGTLTAQSSGGLIQELGLDPQGITIQNIYTQALNGFSAKISAQNLQALRTDKRVKYIEQDSVQHASATQTGATWGLDRIDQTSLPLDRTYTYANTGSSVTAYIVDTGININHTDFGGRAVWGTNTTGDGQNIDCAGHGTHVAGTVGSNTWGVAKGVKLVAVKVLNCGGSGSLSGILNGLNWVASNKTGPSVVNMSLGGGYSSTENSAIANLVSKGITVVVAAGNENQDACNVSPASAPSALTVGATMPSDRRPDYNDWGYAPDGSPQGSNWGTCLDLFAPGHNITSTLNTGTTGTQTMGGTSMASPHVAGAAALVLAANPGYTPSQVSAAILNNTVSGKVTNAGTGSPNKMLYTGFIGGTVDPTPIPLPGTNYSGSLTQGQSYFTNSFSYSGGTLKGSLTASTGTDFDLYLSKWNGSAWVDVASSENVGSNENVSYSATSGTYRWEVYSYSGSGSFNLVTYK